MSYRLEQTSFPKILCECHKQRLSGTLSINHNSINKSVYFEDGATVYASSDIISERFGERLRMSGKLSPQQFEEAILCMHLSQHQLGECLIDLGYLQEAEVKTLLTEQVTQIIFSLFTWQEGQYDFKPGRIEIKGFQLAMPTAEIIFEGIRQLPDMQLLRRWLGDFNRKVVPASDPYMLFQTVSLKPHEAYVISRMDAPLSINELLAISGIPEEQLLRTICALKMAGIVESLEGDTRPQLFANSVAESMQAPSDAQFQSVDAAAAAQLCFEVTEVVRQIEQNADHYQVLGVSRRATPEEIKKAYRERAKKFHPDRHSQLAAFDFQIKSELERVFIRVQEAYGTLGDEAKRRKYDAAVRFPTTPTAPPSSGVSTTAPRPPVTPSTTGSRPTSTFTPTPTNPPPLRPAPPPPGPNVPYSSSNPYQNPAPRPSVPPASSYPPPARPPAPPAGTYSPAPPAGQRPATPPGQPQYNTPPPVQPPLTGQRPAPPPGQPQYNTPPPVQPPPAGQRPPTPPGGQPQYSTPKPFQSPPSGPNPVSTPGPSSTYPPPSATYPPQSRQPSGSYPPAGRTTPRSGTPSPLPPSQTSGITPNLSASEYYMRCIEYLGNNDLEKAYQSIRRSVEMRPKNSEYHAQLARVLMKMQGRNKQAEKEYLVAIELDAENPDLPDLYVELSDLYRKFGMELKANEMLGKALEINPDHYEAKEKAEKYTPPPEPTWKKASGRFGSLVGKVFHKGDKGGS